MKLSVEGLKDQAAWEAAGVSLPTYDVEATAERTRKSPVWVHFGAGNIFRGFIAGLQNELLNKGLADHGIIAIETFDYDILDMIYKPFDNLTLMVTLNPDGTTDDKVIASIAEGVRADAESETDMARLKEIFTDPGLQMMSFTVTEKGYALTGIDGKYSPIVVKDIEEGPEHAHHAMSIVTAMLFERYKAGKYPIAVCSMDNCSHNGEKLMASVMTMAHEWNAKGFVDDGFIEYLTDETKVTFPWSMIDKITPRPASVVEKSLTEAGVENMAPVVTGKHTFIAPFVNAEGPQYLVIEDKFPNGRPPLEEAGVYMTDRDTVNQVERMKVTTCLNPLHTALAVYGCVLGYESIASEMNDPDLVSLIKKIGYDEGMPVVTDPGIISPKGFIDEVIEKRLPNPFMPDTPQRIATDTSQKVSVRYGETIKSYMATDGMDASTLTYIPLALAGWLRYLLAVDDNGEPIELSSDPMLDELKEALAGIEVGHPESYTGQLKPVLSNANIFGVNLYDAGLADKVEAYFVDEIAGPGAVRATLHKALS